MKRKKTDLFHYLKKGGWRALVGAAAIVVATVVYLCVNGMAGTALRRDNTPGRLYTLSRPSREVVNGLEKDVDLLLVADGTEDPRVAELVSVYGAASRHIAARSITPAQSVYYAAAEQTAGTVIVTSASNDVVLPAESLIRSVYTTDGYTQILADMRFCAENEITSAIRYVASELPLACFTMDHGETVPETGLLTLFRDSGYATADLYLSEVCQIPESCALVVSNAPLGDLTEEEADALIAFIEKGGSYFLISDSRVAGLLPNLERVVNAAGMASDPGVVFELDSMHVYNPDYPYFLLPETLEQDLTADLRELGLPLLMAQAHGILPAEGSGAEFFALAQTTDSSYIKPQAYQTGDIALSPDDRLGPFTVAAASLLPSGGKMFWLPAAQCLIDAANGMVGGANYCLVASVLNWMQTAEPLEPLEIATPSLMEAAPIVSNQPLLITLLIALPIALLVMGAVVSARKQRAPKAD